MKRPAIRMMVCLLAILLTGILSAHITTNTESSGGFFFTTARAETVTVTVRQLDMDSNILQSADYEVESGGTLPSNALSGYNSRYKWYDEDGLLISAPSSMVFTESMTITTKPDIVKTGYSAAFYVYLDGVWKEVSSTTTLYGPFRANGSDRYLMRVSQLETAFGEYGFTAESYTNPNDRRIAYGSSANSLWADTTSFEYYGEWVLPMADYSIKNYKIYYLPDNTGDIKGKAATNFQANNAFYTVTLTEEVTGATYTVILEEENVLKEWLAEQTNVTPAGWTYPLSFYHWTTDTGTALADTDTAAQVQHLTAAPITYTLTLQDDKGNTLGTADDVLIQTSISAWLKANDSLALEDGTTIHDYTWKLPNNTSIGTQILLQDTTLVGTKKPVYTVTFLAAAPGSTDDGGSFTNGSESYTTIQVLEGDCVPLTFILRMQQNLQLNEGWAFVEWQHEGNVGYLVLNENTPIVQDTRVWASYTQMVYVRFWTDRNKSTLFAGTGLENQPVGKLYQGTVPGEDAVLAVAPVESMRFRYWFDLNSGQVFTPGANKVENNLDLYPVFERAIFSFEDENGTPLAVLYDGNILEFEAEPQEGEFFLGLEVTCTDGSTLLIPNGTEITHEYLVSNLVSLHNATNGRYHITATPVYQKQRTLVYHTGSNAKFIIYGAEDKESYSVIVDEKVVLLGALDIVNVASPFGLALDGWATEENATVSQFPAYETFENETLDTLVQPGETVHLYPIWAKQENTIAIEFVSNYPADAQDENGDSLTDLSYTIYIKEDSKPTMPSLDKAGMMAPQNLLEDGTPRYVLAGWSLDQEGNNNTDIVTYGTYVPGSQHQKAFTTDKTFYAIWVDRKTPDEAFTAEFFIRADGILPIEPGQFGSSSYLPGGCVGSGTPQWGGTIKKRINVVNNVYEVESNIQQEPDIATILTALQSNTTYCNKFPQILDMTVDDYNNLDSGWWIDWYACKSIGGNCPYYHVDGRVRFAKQVELNYLPNGGTNVPAGTVHDKGDSPTVNITAVPNRENFTFIGWDEDPNADVPDYPAKGMNFPTSPNLTKIYMDEDKDLYAIWQPVKITIPMDDDFKGMKYEQTNAGNPTPPQQNRTYQFTIEAIQLPDGALPYPKKTTTCAADGSFSFPQIEVQVEGMYVFEVREVIGDLPVQYDTSVYRLMINIVESDYGLDIAGYSFTRDNQVIPVTDNTVNNVVFTFSNRTDIRSVTATKIWDDENNQDGLRPASVNVTLRRKEDSIFSQTATLTASGNWTWTWEDQELKDSQTGEIHAYYITEDAVPEYDTLYSGDMNSGLIVTNIHQPHIVNFTVMKIWDDDENAAGLRPETLTYVLVGSKQDGSVVSTQTGTTAADPGSFVFEDVPLYYKGEQLFYTLSEVSIPGYESSIFSVGDGNGGATFNVTNTLKATNVTVTKQVTGTIASKNQAFSFTAHAYDADGTLITEITPGEGYTMDADGTIRFSLRHGESVELQLLPLGGSIVLAEESNSYTPSFSPSGTETEAGMQYSLTPGLDITVTNELNATIPTGISKHHVPYALLFVALLALACLAIKRKAS